MRRTIFLILGAFSRVCRLFALFSPCWLPINTFFSFAFPRCRRSLPMFSVVFSTFHVKHCCFLYEILPLLCSFFTVSGAIFCGFCCLIFLILACCHTVLCGLCVGCLLLAFIGTRCRGIIFLLCRTGIIRTRFGAADFRLNRVGRLANTGWY